MRLHHSLALITAVVLLATSGLQALAHEGHDHDGSTKSVIVPALPRAETPSDTFEPVAIAKTGKPGIYPDRFAMNEPVPAPLWSPKRRKAVSKPSAVLIPSEPKGAVQITTPAGSTVQAKFN
jgi:hypothetical protein